MSGVINKVKAKVDETLHKDKTHTGTTTGTHTGTGVGHTGYSDPTGPHDSHLANKADPRVDSDRYGAAGNTAGAGGVGAGQYGTTGTHHSTTSHSDPTGPHDSRMANKLDPRVDSDQYGAAGNTVGAGGYGSSTTHGTTGGLTGHSTTGTHGTTGGLTGHSTAGTHGTTGGLTGHSTAGTHGTGYSDPTGPHDSRLANKADPRVDSDRYGAAGNTSGAGGVGAGQYTEGYGNSAGTGGIAGTSGGLGGHGTTTGTYNDGTTVHGKPTLMDKLNPKKDADGDGKAGFMK